MNPDSDVMKPRTIIAFPQHRPCAPEWRQRIARFLIRFKFYRLSKWVMTPPKWGGVDRFEAHTPRSVRPYRLVFQGSEVLPMNSFKIDGEEQLVAPVLLPAETPELLFPWGTHFVIELEHPLPVVVGLIAYLRGPDES